jgi:hypothetical protein
MIPPKAFLQHPRSYGLLLCGAIAPAAVLYLIQAPQAGPGALLGFAAHGLSSLLFFRLIWDEKADKPLLLGLSLAYAFYGPFLAAGALDLRTSLLILGLMAGLLAYQTRSPWGLLGAGMLAGVLRLDGALIALSLAAAFYLTGGRPRYLTPLPLAAALLGSLVVEDWFLPGPGGTLADEQFWRILGEWAGGYSEEQGWYQVPLLTAPATLSLGLSLRTSWRAGRVSEGLLLFFWLIGLAWLMAGSGAAFAEFKRMQYPLLAMQYPLAAWLILRFDRQQPLYTTTIRGYVGLILAFSLYSAALFAGRLA